MTSSDPTAAVEAVLVERFEARPARASVSFVGVEPIEVLRFEPAAGDRVYVTLGMSRHPMTAATALAVAEDGPRAELLLEVHDPADRWTDVWRQLAVLAAAPAVEGVVYAPDMTVDLGMPLAGGSRCTGALVAESGIPAIGEVAVLALEPALPNELAWCRVHGAGALRERWVTQQVDLADLSRPAVVLE